MSIVNIKNKVIIFVSIIAILLLITGCGSEKLKSVKKEKLYSETASENKVDEEILLGKDTIEYSFESDTRIITVRIKFDKKLFSYAGDILESDKYSLNVNLDDSKFPIYSSRKEVYKELNNYSELEVAGMEAIRMTSDKNAITMVKIDESTILNIVCKATEYVHAYELFDDSDYKNMIKSIKIDIKKK